MPRFEIPIEQEIRDAVTVPHPGDVLGMPSLKDEIVDCIFEKLPKGSQHHRKRSGIDEFYLPGDHIVYVMFFNVNAKREDDKDMVSSRDENSAQMVYRLLRGCLNRGKVKLEDIQSKVQAREFEKATSAATSLKTPSGKQLPEDVSRIIGKFAATKKVDGGRKTRKTRKTRKHTKRRRS